MKVELFLKNKSDLTFLKPENKPTVPGVLFRAMKNPYLLLNGNSQYCKEIEYKIKSYPDRGVFI
jgi:hypothetical protein